MNSPDPNRSVADPSWEDVLRRGRDEDAGEETVGSVEPDLAYLQLLRHARQPESMSEADLDTVWRQVDAATASERVPFWRRTWVRALMPVGAMAGAVFVFVLQKNDSASVATAVPTSATSAGAVLEEAASAGQAPSAAAAQEPEEEADAKPNEKGGGSGAALILEQQFQTLEPMAREEVNDSVEGERGSMRNALLGEALGAGQVQ